MLPDQTLRIRDAVVTDIEEMAQLMTELGYPTTPGDMASRFEILNRHPDYKTLVAELNGELVGMAGLHKVLYFELNGAYMRIQAFVVKQTARKIGIGRKLIAACEDWGRQQGIALVVLNSGNREERIPAHAFYKQVGYEHKSSGFYKKL